MAMIDDRRKIPTRPTSYVVCTDHMLSGWGLARGGKSYYALAIHPDDDPEIVIKNAEGRTDMKRPRIVTQLKGNGQPIVRLGPHDHLAIVDRESARPWYRPGSW